MGSTEDVFYDADDFSTYTSSETFVVSSSSQQRNCSSPVRSEEEFELADDFSAHSSSALPCPSKPGPSQPRRELATQSSAASKGCVSSASMSTASSLQPEQSVLQRPNELPLALRLLIAKEGYLCREYHRTRCPILRNQVIAHQIDSIRMMIQNPHYKKLADLHLDNNSISTVKELEGSEWFNTFRVLSLRGNMLKQIPVYAFDKAFQSNNNIMHVFLGHNPWRCDCHFIPRFQALLLKYKRVIRDLTDIRCSKSQDKTISLVQISTLPLGNVCTSGVEMPISPINIVNLTLATILFLVIGRFLYDWHSFKNTGKLPWISSILP